MRWRRGRGAHDLRRFRWCLPEFRALTDEEFRRLAEHPRIDRTGLFDDVVPLIPVGVYWLFALLAPSLVLVTGYFFDRVSTGQLVLSLAPAFVGVLLPGAVLGVWLIRRYVRREVLSVFIPTNCPGCRFEIMGLEPEGGAVTCPECGRRVSVVDRMWAAERARPAPGSGGSRRGRKRRRTRPGRAAR